MREIVADWRPFMPPRAQLRRYHAFLCYAIAIALTIFATSAGAQQSQPTPQQQPPQQQPPQPESQQQEPSQQEPKEQQPSGQKQSGQKPARQTAQPQDAEPEKSKIRCITFFLNIERADYEAQIADAYKSLRYARTVFESHGYVVQNLQIATQPFPEYTRDLSDAQALKFFQDLDALAVKNNIQISIGPAMYHSRDSTAQAELLTTVLLNTKSLTGSLMVADQSGLHPNAAAAAARVIKKLSAGTPDSAGALRFAALAMVVPLTPGSPAAYVDGFGHQFAIALQSANLVANAVNGAPDPETAKRRIIDVIGSDAFDVESLAGRVDGETGWAYIGMDLSPEPSKDDSIGAAIESISGHQVGSQEAIAAARVIGGGIWGIGLKQVGFGALSLPILEDRRLAQRWSEGRIGIDTLLNYFSGGSTGLVAVPLPGDITSNQLELIIVNGASAAYRARKAMMLTLLPVASKAAGDRTDFDDTRLANVTLQPLNYPRAKQ
jgi:uncharacterized protein